MAQVTSLSIPNSGGSTFRANNNDALLALFSGNSGATAPSPTVGGMEWLDTSTSPPVLKRRNTANTAWIAAGPETIPANTAWGNFTGSAAAPASADAATVRASMGVPAIPTGTSSVPGQIVLIAPTFGAAYTLPAGGTWLVHFVQFTTGGAFAFATNFTLFAGGTTLAAPLATNAYVGWGWRVV